MKRPVTHGWGAQGGEPHRFAGVDGTALLMYLFRPADEVRRALLLFHGDGRNGGTSKRFFPHARELAASGVLVACADSPPDRPADARLAERAFRAVTSSAGLTTFGLGGSSEGGQVCLALAAEAIGQGDPVHDALVLFNPYLACPRSDRPVPGLPPTIVLHGAADRVVPIEAARELAMSLKESGTSCSLVELPGAAHGFFEYHADDRTAFDETVVLIEEFLVPSGASLHPNDSAQQALETNRSLIASQLHGRDRPPS